MTATDAIFACSVCIGDPNNPVTIGMNMAILFLLAIVAAVLGSLFTFILYLARKQREALAEAKVDCRDSHSHRRS